HASLVDGGRLAHGTVRWWRHNSTESLRSRLSRWRSETDGGALVAAEGIYSMEGDDAPIAEIAAVSREFGARLLVDEAHSLGVIGPEGAGVAAKAGVSPDLVMGTFSKSLASCGGFVAGPKLVLDYLRRTCRPFQFTASGVPAALGAALCAVRLARTEEWRREQVRRRATQLRDGLLGLGYTLGPASGGAIVAILVGSDWDAARMWRDLLDRGAGGPGAAARVGDGDPQRRRRPGGAGGLRGHSIDVGLTGATGHLGGRLLALLLGDPRIERVRTVARGDV